MIMNNKELIDKEDKLHYSFIKNLYNSNLSSYKQELLLNKFRYNIIIKSENNKNNLNKKHEE